MRELDETDLDILQLLVSDARRPYSEMAETVGLSPPAVSDRIERLREHGIIGRFTIELDRSQLYEGTAVLIDLEVDPLAVEDTQAALAAADATEHVFTTAEGKLIAHARIPNAAVRDWLLETIDAEDVERYDVTLLSDTTWTPTLASTEFALSCAECGNTVTSEGTTTRIDDELKQFCCASCETRFVERYDGIRSGADA